MVFEEAKPQKEGFSGLFISEFEQCGQHYSKEFPAGQKYAFRWVRLFHAVFFVDFNLEVEDIDLINGELMRLLRLCRVSRVYFFEGFYLVIAFHVLPQYNLNELARCLHIQQVFPLEDRHLLAKHKLFFCGLLCLLIAHPAYLVQHALQVLLPRHEGFPQHDQRLVFRESVTFLPMLQESKAVLILAPVHIKYEHVIRKCLVVIGKELYHFFVIFLL